MAVRTLIREKMGKPTKQGILFTLEAPFARSVSMAGTFNDWDPAEQPMKKDRNGHWTTQLFLKAGTYEYKFVVDGAWQEDPRATSYSQNPFGTRNAVVTVR